MYQTFVPTATESDPTALILDRIAHGLADMSPQLRKAAHYVLENPNNVGVSSIREIATAARVKPNTLVRMARVVGFEGYEDFREPFRDELRGRGASYPDRARWLQSIARKGKHGELFTEMAAATISNVEHLYSAMSADEVKACADLIVGARVTYVVGAGIFHALAQNFAYLARMAAGRVVSVPREGSLPIDDLVNAGPGDVVLAMTVQPYRSEVVEAVRLARKQGATVIALTDSRASPIAVVADHVFLTSVETPQFFSSAVAATAFLETLMAFVVADADDEVVASIERIDRRRHEIGVYWREQ